MLKNEIGLAFSRYKPFGRTKDKRIAGAGFFPPTIYTLFKILQIRLKRIDTLFDHLKLALDIFRYGL